MVENQNTSDQQGAPDRAPDSLPLPEQPPPNGNEHATKRNHEVWREWVRFGLEVVALFFAIRYVHWTKVQSIATEQAAKAAKDSAITAQTSLIKLQSASVFVPDMDSNWHPDWGKGRKGKFWWHFRPILENAGSTQTKDMTTRVMFEFRDTALPKDFTFPLNKEGFPGIIPPHGLVYGGSSFLTQEQMIQIQKGQKFFYIYGTVTYRDIFDGTPIHTTKFCRQVDDLLGDFAHPDKNKTEMFFGIVFPEQNTAD
jgi:hypothetical protein